MARPKNPRIAVYELIKEAGQIQRAMSRIWGTPAKKLVRDPNGRSVRWVTAPPEDQPENHADEWRYLALWAQQLREQANRIEAMAVTQRRAIERARAAQEGGNA